MTAEYLLEQIAFPVGTGQRFLARCVGQSDDEQRSVVCIRSCRAVGVGERPECRGVGGNNSVNDASRGRIRLGRV